MLRLLLCTGLFAATVSLVGWLGDPPSSAFAQQAKKQPKDKTPAPPAKPQYSTPVEAIKIAKDFQVELLYSVPKETYGSWVAMCSLPNGQLIVSDQYGPLYRLTVPPIGQKAEPKIEKIPVELGSAQGLLWAFDSLYVVVNGANKSGLYRVTASKPNGELDTVTLLKKFEDSQGRGNPGEHGPHAVLKHPDGKRITVVCGNQTKLVDCQTSRVPRHWGEDHLLPRMPDGRGFMAGVLGPGGAIYNVSPDGKDWELFSVGFRNQYDAAYDLNGNLFTYDADMEWDFNTPWYRPTRVCQVTSGSEFGWRNGAGKYPTYYPESLPSVCDIGPGSPTGVTFGLGAKFPAKYQQALFISDWSYGKLYAVHLKPDGSAHKGTAEEFMSGIPLPLTDLVVNTDGAIYFAIGGRRTQSGLYRITYTGKESTEPVKASAAPQAGGRSGPSLEAQRFGMEQYHGRAMEPQFMPNLLNNLNSPDRFVRFSARVALEHQDPNVIADLAFQAKEPTARINALLALARVSAACPQHDKDGKRKGDPELRGKILASLGQLDFGKLSLEQRLEMVRVYQVLFNRFGTPSADERQAWLAKFAPAFPTGNRFVDGELLNVFVFLQDETVAPKAIKLLNEAPTQEEQLEYARALRMLKEGWTAETRKTYFTWIAKALSYKGGNSFGGFIEKIRADAVLNLTADERLALKALIEFVPAATATPVQTPRDIVKKYKLDELYPTLEKGLKAGGRNFDNGRKMFAAANCFGCHRFDNEGGAQGPDLSSAGAKFNLRDLLETIIEPSKEISDQYANVSIDMLDGKSVVGRIINFNGDDIMLLPDMLNPNGIVRVNRKNVDRLVLSKLSPMPAGLLDTLKEDEILDLMAYLLSRGDRNHLLFKK